MITRIKNRLHHCFKFSVLPLAILGACSGEEPTPEGLFFSGACKVDIQASPKGSEIFLDGISVGIDEVSVEIPCGEKQVMVKNKGFVPYLNYHDVSKNKSLNVNVSLAKLDKSHKNFALSDEIIKQVKEGEVLWDPSKGPRPEVKKEEGVYPPYMGDMKTLIASVKGAATTSGAQTEEFETGTWDSVEDWR